MGYGDQRQAIRNAALKQIENLYININDRIYDCYSDSSYSEQRESEIDSIIKEMTKQLKSLKEKYQLKTSQKQNDR